MVLGSGLVAGCNTALGASTAPTADAPARSPARTSRRTSGKVDVGRSVLTVKLDGDDPPLPYDELEAWVRRSGEWVADYCGDFPVPSLEVTLKCTGRGGVGFGQHWDGRWLKVRIGRRTSASGLEKDWVMVHEMMHAAFPDLARKHKWMQEGLSTYVEPLVRNQAGNYATPKVWSKWIRKLPIGRPRRGDRGLDITRSWASLYWGGALFWFAADFRLREATDNKLGLRDAIRGILDAGGNGRADWSTRKVVEVADEATGTNVLAKLYAHMALSPGDVDLDALWPRLGVARLDDGTIALDDKAPLAHIRRAMTA